MSGMVYVEALLAFLIVHCFVRMVARFAELG
jgi:hypothetical protein